MSDAATTRQLITHLMRGGNHGYWWRAEGKVSVWWPTSDPAPVQKGDFNLYFGVHPVTTIPTTNRHGEPKPPAAVRSQISHIAAVNCVFGEFDAKDYGGSKDAALDHINQLGEPPSVISDSGGGYHCFWLLDEPCELDESNRDVWQRMQAAWVTYVGSDEAAKDLARVLRIPGTCNRKRDEQGGYLYGNPPPKVTIIHADFTRLYTLEQITAICVPFMHSPAPAPAIAGPRGDGDSTHAQHILSRAISKVALAKDGMKHDELLKAARLAGGCAALSDGEIETALLSAIAGRAKDTDAALETIRDGIAMGRAKEIPPPPPIEREQPVFAKGGTALCPRHKTPLIKPNNGNGWRCSIYSCFWWQGEGYAPPAEPEQPPAPIPPAKLVSLPQLLTEELPPVRYIIDGLLSEGAALLLGKPKMGKSWLTLAAAIAVASDGYFLGHYPVSCGDVLHLGLEDGRRRLKSRYQKLLGKTPAPERLTIGSEWKRLDEGGLADIQAWIDEHPEARLIIIDTLIKVRPSRQRNGDVYQEDYQPLQQLSEIANRHHVAIVVVHHMRKAGADDFLDSASGTTGLTGAVDTVMGLQRERGASDAILSVTGRDLEQEQELALQWDGQTAQWVIMGDADEYRMSQEGRKIITIIQEMGGKAVSPKDVADVSEKPYSNIKMQMYRMSQRGELIMAERGKYSLPNTASNGIYAQKSTSGNFGNVGNPGNLGNLGYFDPPRPLGPAGYQVPEGFGGSDPPESNRGNRSNSSNRSYQSNTSATSEQETAFDSADADYKKAALELADQGSWEEARQFAHAIMDQALRAATFTAIADQQRSGVSAA